MTPGQKDIEEPFHRLGKRAILAGKGKLHERFLLVQPFAGEQANVRLVSLATPVHQVLGLFLDLLSSLFPRLSACLLGCGVSTTAISSRGGGRHRDACLAQKRVHTTSTFLVLLAFFVANSFHS